MTTGHLSPLHFIREGGVFAHIPALESRQPSNGRRGSMVTLDRFHFLSIAFTSVIGKKKLLDRKECPPAILVLSS